MASCAPVAPTCGHCGLVRISRPSQAQAARAARSGPSDIMASMATDTTSRLVPSSGGSPSSWGLGDGQAIPWEYAPAPEARDIVTIKERYGLFIGGRDVPAEGGATFATVNPATEETMAQIARGTPADADKAVRAARRA